MGGFGYVLSIIVMCLAVMFLWGVLFSYVWRRSSFRRMAADSEQSWLSRLRQTEQDRDTRIAKLRSEVEEHRHQVPTMERSLAERSDIINSLEGKIDLQKGKIKSLEEKIDSLSSGDTNKIELEKITQLEATINSHSQTEKKLNRELDELREKHNETNTRATKAEEELESLTQHQQHRLVAMEERVTDAVKVSEELDASREKVGKLQQELSSVTGRLTKLQNEHGSCSAQLEGVSGKLKVVRAEAESNKKRIEELEQQLAASRKGVDVAKAANDELAKELGSSQEAGAKINELNQTINRLRSQNELSGTQLSKVELRKTELEQTLRSRVEEATSSQREVSELRNATAELEARNAQLEDQFQRATSELSTAKSQAEDARKEFAQWRDQAEQLENLLQAHQATANEAKEHAGHWQSEHDKLKAQWANESALLEESRRQVQVLKHELKDASQLVQTVEAKQSEWQQRLDENERSAAAETRELKSRLAELTKQLAGSDDRAEEVAMLRRTLELRDSEFTAEHQQHNKQRQSAEDWRQRYERLKTEHDALAASRKTPAKRKSKKAPAAKSTSDKPNWLLSKAPKEKDDLKKIWGVGPVMEKTMNSLGIYLFRQVAALGKKDIEWVTTHINTFPDRIIRDDWVGQAAKLRKEKYGR